MYRVYITLLVELGGEPVIAAQRVTFVEPAQQQNVSMKTSRKQGSPWQPQVHSRPEGPGAEYPPPSATMSLPPIEYLQLKPRSTHQCSDNRGGNLDSALVQGALVPSCMQQSAFASTGFGNNRVLDIASHNTRATFQQAGNMSS